MHIMEGFLPIEWAVFWTIVCIPFLIFGIRSMRKLFIEHPEKKLSLALSGAFIVILSSLKIPSVGGSSSHPTGTGMCVMLSGPTITAVICTIVLLFQGTFMAHGGFTTLGANIFSMGIAGPFAAYAVFKALRKRNANPTVTVFVTVFAADIITYLVTALQLTLIVPFAGMPAIIDTYSTFFSIFAVTQLPIAVVEGVLMVLFFQYLADIRPELVKNIGYKESVRNTKSALGIKKKEGMNRSRLLLISFAAVMAVMIALVYFMVFFGDIPGADDSGAEAIEVLIPGFEQLTENFIQLGEFGISILFILQTLIGVAILAAVVYLLRRKKHGYEHGDEFSSVDTAAYRSPMLRWPPLAKLLLILMLLVLNIASPSIWMSVFTGLIGLSLLLYASSMRLPKVMAKLFVYAQVFVMIGAFIFTIATSGETVMAIRIFGITINFTDAGVSLALLVYARATAALLLMFAFAASTPVPHLAAALKKLRLPDVFVEMVVLIYRYTFLLMESSERTHLAAECRFGYSGYGKSVRTTSKLTVSVFMRSLDTAEKGQAALQCRNYRGEFQSLSELGKQNMTATAFCAFIACASVVFFFALRNGVLLT